MPNIAPGDIILGLSSSGVHSNGFSLVRKIIDSHGLSYASPTPWNPASTVGDSLLIPTTIYVKQLLPVVRLGLVKGLCHITGGGFTENVPRVLPSGTGCWIDAGAFEFLPVFDWMMRAGGVEAKEMARTFNCGIGMIVVVAPERVEEVTKMLKESGDSKVYQIGEVNDVEGCEMRNLDKWGR